MCPSLTVRFSCNLIFSHICFFFPVLAIIFICLFFAGLFFFNPFLAPVIKYIHYSHCFSVDIPYRHCIDVISRDTANTAQTRRRFARPDAHVGRDVVARETRRAGISRNTSSAKRSAAARPHRRRRHHRNNDFDDYLGELIEKRINYRDEHTRRVASATGQKRTTNHNNNNNNNIARVRAISFPLRNIIIFGVLYV